MFEKIKAQNEFIEVAICKMCFDKHELEYGHQPVNCAFRAFDNEDCPKITTLKKLIQEHFDGDE